MERLAKRRSFLDKIQFWHATANERSQGEGERERERERERDENYPPTRLVNLFANDVSICSQFNPGKTEYGFVRN